MADRLLTERRGLPRGMTPRLLSREVAAAYCGVSVNMFEMHVAVDPVKFGSRKLWDIRALDRWLDQKSGLMDAFASDDQLLEALDGDPREGR